MGRKKMSVWAAVCIVALTAGCAGGTGAPVPAPDGPGNNLAVDTQRVTDEEFRLVLSGDDTELYYKDSTAEIAVKDLQRGTMWYSNPQDWQADTLAAGQNADLLQSQVQLRYLADESTVEAMDSFRYSTSLVQHSSQVEGDSLRVTYQFGENTFQMDYLPQALSEESMNRVLAALDEEEAEEITKRYEYYALEEVDESLRAQLIADFPLIEQTPLYIRENFPEYIGEEIYALFQKAGYTREDLLADNKANGIEAEIQEPISITLSLVYTLADGGFSVTVPVGDIRGDEKTPVTDIALLPFFGCGGAADKGQILVPDGSGAIIRFNNGKVTADGYEQRLFGRDRALSQQNQDPPTQTALLPVFGIGRNDAGFIASIDSGYEAASVLADIAGKTSSYNYAYSRFRIRPYEQISMGGEGSAENVKYAYPANRYSEDLTVSYRFTDGPEVADLANAYREYLVERGVLKEKRKESPKLNLELTATVPEKKNILGIQYEALGVTTDFRQAAEIVRALGAEETALRLTSALDGGKYQKRVDKAGLLGSLGGATALRELQEACGQVFFNLDVQTADTAPKSLSARALSKDVVKLYSYDPISRYYEYNQRFQVLLSPWELENTAAAAVRNLSRDGIEAVAADDIAYQISSDFNREREADTAVSLEKSRAALKTLSDTFALSVEAGGFHTLDLADRIWNLPDSSSGFAIEDESVPFYPMVVHGYIPYCLPPINDAADRREALLRSVEYGAQLQYTLVYRNVDKPVDEEDRFYNRLYTHYVEEIPAFYNESRPVLEAVEGACIVDRQAVGEDAVAVTYDNGAVVLVNYSGDALTYDGQQIPGRAFGLVKPAA